MSTIQNMTLIQDVKAPDDTSLFFYKDPNDNTDMDVTGIAWLNPVISRKSGLKISFKPSIITDINYYGLQKYPQGFAFILTSNPVQKTIGEKRSGLGFEGIYNSIAFFFDFITNLDKLDANFPHFSITYNLNGQIKSICGDPKLCNIKIPNFYDDEMDDFISNMKISIELFNGQVKVFFNEKTPAIVRDLPEYSYIMDNDIVHFGVSSSMTLYKGVKIEDLKLMTIVSSDTPYFELQNSQNFIAGSILKLYLLKKTSCSTKLNIFTSEQKQFKLRINDDEIFEPLEMKFNHDRSVFGLETILHKVEKEGITRFTAYWEGKPIKTNFLNVVPSNSLKFDICNPKYDPSTNALLRNGTTSDKFYTFDVCVSDLYRNSKSFDFIYLDDFIKVEYPFNIIPEQEIKYTSNKDKTVYKISVPTVSKGVYKIHNPNFFGDNIKSFTINSGKPDLKKSYGEIKDFLENRITQAGKVINLGLFIRDALGNSILNEEFKKLKCSFQKSVVVQNFQNTQTQKPLGEYDIIDGILDLNFSPTNPGQYTFVPRLQCDTDTEAYEIVCTECTFYVSTSTVDNTKFQIYSDYYEKYFVTSELNESNQLKISMDEEKNFKLTTILILDTSGVPILVNNLDKSITDALNSFTAKITYGQANNNLVDVSYKINPAGGIDIFMDNKSDRTKIFSSLEKYKLVFSFNNASFKTNEFSIPIVFSYRDDFLNNISNLDIPEAPENFYAVYKAGTYELKATSNQFLFRIIAKNTQNQISYGKTLDCTKVVVEAYMNVNSDLVNISHKCIKSDMFLNVSGSFLKSGLYDVRLFYNKKQLFNINKLKINPRGEVVDLTFDNKNALINNFDSQKNVVTLNKQPVGQIFSFEFSMVDEYGNVINEKLIHSMNQIKIENKGNGQVTQLFDGRLLVTGEEKIIGDYSVVLTLSNNKSFTLIWKRISEKLDPHYSGSDMFLIEKEGKNYLEVSFYAFDQYNKNLAKEVLENKTIQTEILQKLQIYAINPKNKIVNFEFSSYLTEERYNLLRFTSKEDIKTVGEYKLIPFYDNIPIICQVCYAKLNPIKINEKTSVKTDIYYAGYKSNSKLLQNDKYHSLTETRNIPIFAKFRDINGNEINYNQKLDLGVYSEEGNKEIARFCHKNYDYKTRQYLEICKEYLTDVNKMEDGNYYIATTPMSEIKYKFTIQKKFDEISSTPSVKYSWVRSEDGVIIGSIDTPARIIVDFRNERNQRFENLDLTKITLKASFSDDVFDMKNEKMKIFYGPLKGLITILVYNDKLISEEANATVTIFYDKVPIISGSKIVYETGRIAKIELVDKETKLSSSKRFNIFRVLDMNNNPIKNLAYRKNQIFNNIITIKDTNRKAFYDPNLFHNALTGTISLSLDLSILNELEINSPFIATPIKIPSIPLNLDFTKSFVYLDNINDGQIGDEIALKVQLMDINMNYVPNTQEINNLADKFSVMILRNNNNEIEFIETINFNKNFTNDKNGIVLTKKATLSGDYFFMPFYNKIPIKCTYCRKIISSGSSYDLSLTSLKIKLGTSWEEKSKTSFYNLYKKNLPVFKIYLKDSSGTIINTPISDLSASIVNEKGDVLIPMNLYLKNTDGIYAYLDESGRNKLIGLDISNKISLKIFKSNDVNSSILFENFILLNSEIRINSNVQCPNETVAQFFDKEDKYVITAGKEAYIEFNLIGCENDENSLNDKNEDFLITVCPKNTQNCDPINAKSQWYYKIIPSDGFGKYILLIGSNLFADNQTLSIKYKKYSASEKLNLNVISDNKINSIYYSDKNYEIRNGFIFLKLKIQDSNNNIIKRDSTNIFLKDIFVDIVDSENKKIAYDLTYKSDSDEFYVKLLSSDDNNFKINIPNSKQNSISIAIKDDNDSLINSVFTFEKFIYAENSLAPNAVSFKIEYKNALYQTVSSNEKIKNLLFRFDSVDSNTNEDFTIFSDNISYEAGSIIVKFDSNLKLLQYSNIQPLAYNFDEIACTNCFMINKSLNYVYISSSKNDNNHCFMVPFDKVHLLKGSRDKILAWYEGTANDFKLFGENKTKEIKISTVSKPIGNGLIQTFIGFDFPNNDLKEINYNLVISNGNIDTKSLQILNSKDDNTSTDKINLNNVVISGLKGSRFYAGQTQYFFIELRDSNQKLVRTPTTFSTLKDIKYNVINTAYEGLFLFEYTVERIPDMEFFKLKIDQEELNFPIYLNVLPDYPEKMDSVSIHSKEIINDRNVKYQVSVYDKFGNTVCDERLNFEVINEENMNDFYLSYDEKADICYSEFLFYGKSVLISPLLGDIQLTLENLKEIHPSNFNSYVNLKSNNFMKDEIMSITTVIYDEYGKYTSPEGLQINLRFSIYYIFDDNQKILVKDFSTASISTDIDIKNFNKYGNYLIKTIVNGIELTRYTLFKLNRNVSKDVSGISLKIKRNNIWSNIDNIYNEINTLDEIQNSISYPYTFLLSLVNTEGIKIGIPKDIVVEVSLIPDPKLNLGVEKLIDLDGILNTQTTYLITEPKLSSNMIFHLPKGKYYIKIVLNSSATSKITKFVPFLVEKGLYQNDDLNYHMPSTNLDKSFEIVAMDGINTIYSNLGSYSTANICIRFSGKVLNQYLDPSLFKVNNLNNSNCFTYAGSFYRGCTQFSIMCSALNNGIDNVKTQVVYNGITSSNEMFILIDPSLPPAKFLINSKFPETAEQMSPIISNFKVLDKDNKEFKYLNTENFEVFDNNKKLGKNLWKLVTNNGANIQINLAYPPKSHNIKVLFKNTNGLFMNIKDMNSLIQVSQGAVNLIKTIVSIPIYYRSGDLLQIPILFRDNFGNCYEDKVDVNLIKLKISKDNESFENFKFTEEKYETEICSKYVLAKAINFNLNKIGSYKVEFSYNSTPYPLPFKKLYITSNKISPKTSSISVRGKEVLETVDVKTGEKFEILIKGTDINGNQVEYGELIEKLYIKIGNLIEDKDYKVFYASDNNYMIITLMIYQPDIYNFEILLENEVFNSDRGLKKITVKRGDCDRKYHNIKLDKEKFFVGESAELRVYCRDSFNNTVDSINEKDFSLKIKGEKLEEIENDILPYTLSAKQDTLTSSFLILYTGMYDITVYLKGAQYGDIKRIEVIREKCNDSTPYMCANRKCVAKASECPDLVDEHCTDPEKPFYCTTGEQKSCVAKLEDCKCKQDQTECKGMCIPKSLRNFCVEKPNVDCSHIKGATACFDGTCKILANCGNDLACPLGYKICGAKCIIKKEACLFEPEKCKNSEVTCWDYSCAKKYENCPTRKVCINEKDKICPDGTCVSIAEKCPQPKECRAPFKLSCHDFTCRKSEKDCPRKIVCEPGMSLCEDDQCALDCKNLKRKCAADKYECKSGTCVDLPQLCSSDIACLENQIKCNNGACVKSIEECKFFKAENKITCSNKTPMLCADLSCVDDIEKCRDSLINNIKCPKNVPYRCPNNECRRQFRECPTTTTCPENFPILCSDGSCQKASYHCRELDFDINSKSNKVLCSDGSYAVSISLCPTQVTCNEGMIKCWNGACAFSVKDCLNPKYFDCPTEFPFRCVDGSCRISRSDCASISPCPVNKPIKCLDGSCRESLDLCPKVNTCPSNYVPCPNGTCAAADKCSTEITCLRTKPILCQNKKCVKDYRECEKSAECTKGFLCPDGECVSNRLDCMYSAPCDSKNPVRCENRSCVPNTDACNAAPNECPIGYIKCKSGVCKANEDLCKEELCPPHRPFKCQNGECAVSEEFCDTIEGCPMSYPNKCMDGSCKQTKEECKTLENEVHNKIKAEVDSRYNELKDKLNKKYDDDQMKSDNDFEKAIKAVEGPTEDVKNQKIEKMKAEKQKTDLQRKAQKEEDEKSLEIERQKESELKLCEDGSKMIGKPTDCPLKSGCPKDQSIRCSDGTCAKDRKDCFAAKCNFEKPIKCANGVCVKFASDCALLSTIMDDYEACTKIGLQGYFMCADGVCVMSPENCRPLYDCPPELSKCDDGTCRVSEFCPKVIEPCPKNRPIKCNDGRCIDSFGNCNSFNNICIGVNSNRCSNGLCNNNSTLCEDVKLSSQNTCEFTKEEKESRVKVTGFKCGDGRCMENEDQCYSVDLACSIENPVLCQDGTCRKSFNECVEIKSIGCNLEKEVACPNKLCVPKQDYLTACKNKLGCPLVKPIRCANGECVATYDDCASTYKCPILKPFRCADLRCVEDLKFCNTYNNCKEEKCEENGLCIHMGLECKNLKRLCPLLAPVRCHNGLCVANVNECENSFYKEKCKEGEFFCLIKGECLKNKSDCIGEDFAKGGVSSTTRLLQNDSIENNCSYDYPYSCFDGTCRKKREECSLPNACLASEFKCVDGTCVKDSLKCKEKSKLECKGDLIRCNDGLCRKTCPNFNGCDTTTPYQCSNGRCVRNKLECSGYSMCPENQYRCINGECKMDPNDCDDIKRLYSPIEQSITVSRFDGLQAELVFDKKKKSIVSLFIPANSLNVKNDLAYSSIEINPVAHSYLRSLSHSYNQTETFLFKIANAIKDSDGELNFDNSVVSPIVNITCAGCENQFFTPVLLRMEHNYHPTSELSFENYCLAKLINNKWRCFDEYHSTNKTLYDLKIKSNCTVGGIENVKCNSRKTSEEQTSFAIDSFGVYAVVIIPVNSKIIKEKKDNVIFNNLKLVIISTVVTSAVILIIYLFFLRILRYRKKYIENKKRIENIKSGVSNMMNMNLAFPGATIGDAINQINFEPNPCFKIKQLSKDPVKEKEDEIDRMTYKFTSMENNNEELIGELERLKEEYNELRRIVDKMKKS